MKSNTKYTPKEIEELLASDDELPDSYDEIPDIPAYQNDNRFERLGPIKFEWLHQNIDNISTQARHTNQQSSSHLQAEVCSINKVSKQQCSLKELFPESSKIKEDRNMILISKGIMTKRDLFFIKSVEEFSTDITLMWFIDFLNYKAVRPLQRSCLVGDITVDRYNTAKEPLSNFNKRYYFKLVVN